MKAGQLRPGIRRRDEDIADSASYSPKKLEALDHIGQAIARLDQHGTDDCVVDVYEALHAYDGLGWRE